MNTTAPPTHARPLTPRQREVLDLIRHGIDANGHPPTLQEIADDLKLSKVSVFEHATALETKGWITRDKHRQRSIRLVEDVCPRCGRGGR